jgi:hypothetical protein
MWSGSYGDSGRLHSGQRHKITLGARLAQAAEMEVRLEVAIVIAGTIVVEVVGANVSSYERAAHVAAPLMNIVFWGFPAWRGS